MPRCSTNLDDVLASMSVVWVDAVVGAALVGKSSCEPLPSYAKVEASQLRHVQHIVQSTLQAIRACGTPMPQTSSGESVEERLELDPQNGSGQDAQETVAVGRCGTRLTGHDMRVGRAIYM